jgi:galactokinase
MTHGRVAPERLVDALAELEPAAASDRAAVRVVRAPGRVNLIGEHTDYNLGLVLPVAIDREIHIAAVPTGDRRVELTRLDTGERLGFELDIDRPRDGTWIDYIAGTAFALRDAGLPVRGIRGVIGSDLPEGAGLSSSAALELAAAWAVLDEAAAKTLDRLHLARICQSAENGYVGVHTGLMDQFASSCGVAGSALLLDCRSLAWRRTTLPTDLRLVVVHTGSPRRLDASPYNLRREQCDSAVAALRAVDPRVRSLRDVTPDLLAAQRDRLDPVVARRAEHVIAENLRVLDVVAAFEVGDLEAVGVAFAASHASLRDLYEVSSVELDALVEIAATVDGVVGSRMTGAGFGGCTVNLVRASAMGPLRRAIDREYHPRSGRSAMIFPVAAADGAGPVQP